MVDGTVDAEYISAMSDLIKPIDAAGILKVTRARVSQLMNAGTLPFVEVAGLRLLRRPVVEAYAAGPRLPGRAPGTRPKRSRKPRKV